MTRKKGIFGATFDPPHLGHLIAMNFALEELKLDEIIMIPANLNPLKQYHIPAPPEIRLEMLKSIIKQNNKLEISDIELKRGGVSYMIDTIRELKDDVLAESEIYLLIGADSAIDFTQWKDYKLLAEICKIAVFNRPGWSLDDVARQLPIEFISLRMPLIGISSTLIREMVAAKKSIDHLTPEVIVRIIRKYELYK
jgi:nicotinate-nucleotide adenylyltransferase